MSDRDISRALHAHLEALTLSPALRIQWRPDLFSPLSTESWLRPTYLTAGDIPISTCPIQTRSQRIYEVDCFSPERDGYDESLRIADLVSAHFFPETGETNFLTAGDYRVQINRKPTKEQLEPRGGFVGYAVLIDCFALT